MLLTTVVPNQMLGIEELAKDFCRLKKLKNSVFSANKMHDNTPHPTVFCC